MNDIYHIPGTTDWPSPREIWWISSLCTHAPLSEGHACNAGMSRRSMHTHCVTATFITTLQLIVDKKPASRKRAGEGRLGVLLTGR